MASTQTRLSLAAVGMVVSYNLFCWLPSSIWAFTIAASSGFTFLFVSRPVWVGTAVGIMAFIAGMITSRALPVGYGYYFAGFWTVLVFLPAGLLASGIRRGISAFRTQLLAIVPVTLLMFLYLMNLGGVATAWKQVLADMSTSTIEWYSEAMGTFKSQLSPEEIDLMKNSIRSMFDFFYRFSPGLVICWAAGMNLAVYFFAGMMIRKTGNFYRQMTSFTRWKMSFASLVILAFGLVLWVIDADALKPIADNLLFVMGVAYMVSGLALMEYLLKRRRIHGALRATFYLMLFLSGWFGGALAAIVGLVDSHFDFRKVRAQQIG